MRVSCCDGRADARHRAPRMRTPPEAIYGVVVVDVTVVVLVVVVVLVLVEVTVLAGVVVVVVVVVVEVDAEGALCFTVFSTVVVSALEPLPLPMSSPIP